MLETKRLELELLLPPEPATCAYCLTRLETLVESTAGVVDLDISPHRSVAVLHFNPEIVSLAELEALVRQEGARLGTTYAHRVLPIEGMDCADCALTLERGVARLAGVQWAEVNFTGARMSVEFDTSGTDLDAIGQRIEELGYSIGADSHARPDDGERAALRRLLRERETLQTLIAAVLTVTGIAVGLAGAGSLVSTFLYAAAILIGGVPIARKGIVSAWATRRFNINVLMTIAVVGAALIGEWLEAATVVVLFSLGETLEGYSMDRARRSIRSLMRLAPTEALVRDGNHEQRVPVAEITPGSLVVVRPGERIPLDGIVASGESAVDQAPVTGESVPVEKRAGADVFAGTINGASVLEIRTTRQASDSTIARIIRMVEDAQAHKAPAQRFVDTFATYYTPAVVGLAALIAIAPPLLYSASWLDWLYRALVLLVIACPCALVISTPVTIVSAISNAARNGVLIKGGAHLEAAGSLKALAFDKTGTLTKGTPEVVAVTPLNGWAEDDLLRVAAVAEQYSEHPLGVAIVRAAQARGLDWRGRSVADVSAQIGRGIQARVDGRFVRVGTRGLILDGEVIPDVEERLGALERSGQTCVLVSVDDRLAGIIALADTVRPKARSAIESVKQAGIEEVVMLTGDRREVAESIGARIGVDAIEPELLPEQKVGAVERLLKKHGRIGMVGDGINDAPALARATVGIAMGAAGTDAALETADIALMGDNLGKVGFTMRLSRRARRVIAQNVGLSLAIKLAVLLLAIGGAASLWEAIFADVGASLIVIANGMRMLRFR